MWFQGEEAMPPITKACYRVIKAHAGQHPVHLVTEENIRQYTSTCPIWDDEIYTWVKDGVITKTHFSDIFRSCMLYTTGGVWIDSTLLINKDIDDIVGGLCFVSGRREKSKDNYVVVRNKWTTYFVGTAKDNPVMGFIYEVLRAQVQKEGRFVDYNMMDYAFEFAYRHLPYVKQMVEAIPLMPSTFWDLYFKMYQPFTSPEDLQRLRNEAPFSKLTYKGHPITTTSDGRPTFYAYIIEHLQA